MRVVRIITRLNVGGPSIQAMTLSDRLRARGVETRYLPALRRPVAPLHDAIAFAQILDILRAVRPQIVHTHMAKAGTLGRLAAAFYNRTAGRLAPVRVVHTYHGHVLEGYFGSPAVTLFTRMERHLAAVTDAIVAISPQIRRELLGYFQIGRPAQYHVVPLGFDLTELSAIDDDQRRAARAALDIPPGAHVVTTVGRLTAIKQHHLFLDVAQQVAKSDPAALFLIAGDGELRAELQDYARQLGIAERTRFLGWRRDLATIYAATDVFLLTSRNEGTPVALIESLAAGVPGVSTDVGGVGDVVDSDAIGLLAPFGDAPGLARHVQTLLADPARRRGMGARGRAAMARYHVDRLLDDTDALYREVIGSRP